jgi:ATP-binding cassette, subfamily C (CFTR/MRP), member 4
VGRHLFDKCIKEFLCAKSVILVTHQLQYLKDCDNILVLDNGKQISHGPVVEFIQRTSKTGAQSQDTTAFMHIVREFMTEAESVDTSSQTSASTVKANAEFDTLEKDMATLKEVEFADATELADDPGKNILLGEEEEYDPTRNMISVEDQAIGSTPLRTYIEFFRIGSPSWVLLLLSEYRRCTTR